MALDNKQTVNGCATKGAFAKAVGYSRRALEYIVYGRPEKKKEQGGAKGANTCSHAGCDGAERWGSVILNANKIEDLIQNHPVPEYINMRLTIWWFCRTFNIDEDQYLVGLAKMFDAGLHDLTEEACRYYRRMEPRLGFAEFVDFIIQEAV